MKPVTTDDQPSVRPYTVVFVCPDGHRWTRDEWDVLHWVAQPGPLMDRLTYGIPRSDDCPECGVAAVTGDYDNGNPVPVYNTLGEEGWLAVRDIRIRNINDGSAFHYIVRCVACGESWDSSGGRPDSVIRLHENSCTGEPRDDRATDLRASTLATQRQVGKPPEARVAKE